MDLSSLEGPPLCDNRFSAPVDVPRVEIDESPRRSSHAIPSSLHDRGTTTTTTTIAAGSRRDSHMEEMESSVRTARGRENSRGTIDQPRSHSALSSTRSSEQQQTTLRPSRSHPSLPSSQSDSNNSPSGGNQSGYLRIIANDHLVWLEDEKVWIKLGSPAPSGNTRSQNSCSAGSSHSHTHSHTHTHSYYPANQNQNPTHPALLQYYDPYANEYEDPDDLPPSYESHGFVQTRTGQPVAAHESRWMAVAERVGRALYA
ncbi:hypothetical protein VTN96DRAFT_140 [Rasamsonia emersonii]